MCGICAHSHDPAGEAVRAMAAQIVHRGPDDDGFHVDRDAGVALGARRLSIIDVAGGHQPMTNESGKVAAALNGEIYNFASLRALLVRRGHVLRTHCDTEVLVHLYEDHGPDLVHALEGMFSFVLWDAEAGVLVAARDRFGEKPLFYAHRDGALAIASEATALTRTGVAPATIDPEALDAYFVLGYVEAPRTIFAEVRQLPPGHLLVWHHGERRLQTRPYWQPPVLDAPARRADVGELTAELEELLVRSMRSRLVADVPLGLFLSGGIDSGLVAALAARHHPSGLKTFTIGYDVGDTSELEPARASARQFGSEHHELVVSSAEVAARTPAALGRLDQPLADQAFIALHLLAEFARQWVTVAVGGEGVDELFGGYPRYRWLELTRRVQRAVPAPVLATAAAGATLAPERSRARRFGSALATRSIGERHLDWVSAGRRHVRPALYGPALQAHAKVDVTAAWGLDGTGDERHAAAELMRLDQLRWLPDDVLAKADRATMLASLEMRTPFLHREVAEFAAAVPVETHLADGGKALPRRLLHDLAGPELARRAKRAFRVPVADWLRGPLSGVLDDQLDGSALYGDGWFRRDAVRALAAEHRAGERDHADTLWPLLALGCWFDAGAGARAA
jgi:asparagine synthase (glutamine-hydrolysing)